MTDPTLPSKTRAKRRKPLSAKHQDAIAIAVASGDPKAVNTALAKANHTPSLYNQKISDGQLEVILTRLAAGEYLVPICEDLGISAALVRKRQADHPAFGDRVREAQRIAADYAFDQQLAVAFDMTIEAPHKKIIIDVLDRRAKVHNRALYGDKVAVDVRAVVIKLDDDDMGLC